MFSEILYKTDQITHEILKQCDGMEVSFVLDDKVESKVQKNGQGILYYDKNDIHESIYILNNEANGSSCGDENKKGFKYSWVISFSNIRFEDKSIKQYSHIESLTIYKDKAKKLYNYNKLRNYLEGILK